MLRVYGGVHDRNEWQEELDKTDLSTKDCLLVTEWGDL